MSPANSQQQQRQQRQRRPTASAVLGPSFQERQLAGASDATTVRVAAPEAASSDGLSELSLAVQLPPMRVAPPGHESFVSLASVKEDPNQVVANCEDEYSQERQTNLDAIDDVTVVDPAEEAIELASKDVNLRSFINKCLRMSVKQTRSATRDARLLGLRSLRTERMQHRLTACASSNMESDDEDDDLDDLDDD